MYATLPRPRAQVTILTRARPRTRMFQYSLTRCPTQIISIPYNYNSRTSRLCDVVDFKLYFFYGIVGTIMTASGSVKHWKLQTIS